jgi:hypothetical protein
MLPFEVFAADLPIDINAIGHGEQTESAISLRFFEFDLFSENPRRINETMAEHLSFSRMSLEEGLFEAFEVAMAVDINEQISQAAISLNLFAEPVSFGRIGQGEVGDEIPLWVIVLVLVVCAVLGYVIARMVVSRKESKEGK